MESRFRELLTEAVKVAEEYHADFRATLKPPVVVTAFRYKSGKAKKPAPLSKQAARVAVAAPPPAKRTRRSPRFRNSRRRGRSWMRPRRRANRRRDLDDRIYEIEDALRLAMDVN